jgi:hypothetical protein
LTQFQRGVIFKIVNFGLRAFAVLIYQSGQARREFTPQERSLTCLSKRQNTKLEKDIRIAQNVFQKGIRGSKFRAAASNGHSFFPGRPSSKNLLWASIGSAVLL